jgi:uncharacterized protein
MNYRDPFAAAQSQAQSRAVAYDMGLRAYMLKIYNLMASALVLTGLVALFTAQNETLLGMLYQVQDGRIAGMTGLGMLVAFAPLGLAMLMGFGVNRLSASALHALYWGYAVLMGLSLSSLFLMYTGTSIARVFFITAGMFGAMSLYGYTTKRDLTGFGSFLIMGAIGLLIASVVNIFLQSSVVSFATSVLSVLVFTGLTAYDTQKLKAMYYQFSSSAEMMAKATIMGALNLYMDFIVIFVNLLRLIGERR